MAKVITTRPHFVSANPHLLMAHRNAQKAMFGAAGKAGLGTTDDHRDAMLEGINAALGLKGSKRLVSRSQMTVVEQMAIAEAIKAELFSGNWEWDEAYRIEVNQIVMPVTVEQATIIPLSTGEAVAQTNSLSGPVPEWIAHLL